MDGFRYIQKMEGCVPDSQVVEGDVMTEIDFVVDDVVLRVDASESPETRDPAVLEFSCFEMPVRLRVGDVELLEWTHRVLAPGFLCNESGELVPHEFLSPPLVPGSGCP